MKRILFGLATISTSLMLFGCSKTDKNMILSDNKKTVLGYKDLKVKKVVIPKGVTKIGNSAFSGCSELEEVVFSDTLTTIDDYAFSQCSKIKSITFPDSLKSIGNRAFEFCTFDKINLPDGFESIGDSAFLACEEITHIVFPSSFKSIGVDAFSSSHGLIYVEFNEGITSIRRGAFNSYKGSTIVFPKSLVKIEQGAFQYAHGIQKIFYRGTLEEWNNVVVEEDNYKIASATICTYSETKPSGEGNFWHYGDQGYAVSW